MWFSSDRGPCLRANNILVSIPTKWWVERLLDPCMAKSSVRNGQRRVDPLAAIFNMQNQTGKVSRQKQEYQRQGRDVNNTRQKSGSQAQVQRSKVRQSGVKHRDSRMNRRTLRNVTRGKQDFALGECLCAAYMWVREWGAGVVRQSEWWVNGDSCVIGVMVDGNVWVQCMMGNVVHGWCAVWVSGNQIHNSHTGRAVLCQMQIRIFKAEGKV